MDNAFVFIVSTLVNLYIIAFIVRIILQSQRADTRNPMVQFILKVTNPLVLPLRRYMPSAYGLDTSSLVVAVVFKAAEFGLLLTILCNSTPGFAALAGMTVFGLLRTVLNLYFFLVLMSVIMSWVSTGSYNPAAMLVNKLAEPVLSPFRKLIPPIGGIDITPILAIIAIQALTMLLPQGQFFAGLGCPPAVAMI
jgi:YggT family protein